MILELLLLWFYDFELEEVIIKIGVGDYGFGVVLF